MVNKLYKIVKGIKLPPDRRNGGRPLSEVSQLAISMKPGQSMLILPKERWRIRSIIHKKTSYGSLYEMEGEFLRVFITERHNGKAGRPNKRKQPKA